MNYYICVYLYSLNFINKVDECSVGIGSSGSVAESAGSDTDEEEAITLGEYKTMGPVIKAMEELSYQRKYKKELRELLLDT